MTNRVMTVSQLSPREPREPSGASKRKKRRREGRMPRNTIREHRLLYGISQRQVATATGMTDSSISFLETGTSSCDIYTALLLARFFECPVEELFQLPEADR